MRISIFLAGALASLLPAQAEEVVKAGDFYLISRQADGTFHGSHQVLEEQADGYVAVAYCGRKVWVRPKSVAWSLIEVENKRLVRLEYSNGRGWVEVCAKAENHVSMADIGSDEDPLVVSNEGSSSAPPPGSKLSRISEAFANKSGGKARGTYHQQ
ncbi:hypothetical protein [Pannonibacter phragmitetus]|uniref:hypothetical protein n=1 Tax=Pannonibacter phragmitetus TaxID=121719 RepID=UPI003D2F2CB6